MATWQCAPLNLDESTDYLNTRVLTRGVSVVQRCPWLRWHQRHAIHPKFPRTNRINLKYRIIVLIIVNAVDAACFCIVDFCHNRVRHFATDLFEQVNDDDERRDEKGYDWHAFGWGVI